MAGSERVLTRERFWRYVNGVGIHDGLDYGVPSAADVIGDLMTYFQPEIPRRDLLGSALSEPEQCGCDVDAGIGPCKWCVERGEQFVGKRIRDSHGREWTVTGLDSKNGLVTLQGSRDEPYWAYVDDVDLTVLEDAPQEQAT